MRRWSSGLVVCLAALASSARAEVKLPAIIGDNMVVQRGIETPIWGWAAAGEEVVVRLGDAVAKCKAGADGRFAVRLPARNQGENLVLTVTAPSGKASARNILVGEVWLASGQSNMEWTVSNSLNAAEEIAAAKYPKIRLFAVERTVADTPQADCKGQWQECAPETIPGFSAVAYFFGRHLHKELGVNIGLIKTAWGGTPAEAWTSLPSLEALPVFQPTLARWQQQLADWPKQEQAAMDRYAKQLARWKEQAAKARAEKKEVPRAPREPVAPQLSPHRPASLYNGMLAPLVPFAVRGAIWYQGESNVGRAEQYRTVFPAMIADWRRAWGQGDFPFAFVQLAPYRYGGNDPAAWAELCEAQTMTLARSPNTGMAVTVDVGDVKDIHPKDKQTVGRRLGLWALNKVYGRPVEYAGPAYAAMTLEGDRVRLRLHHAAGLKTADGRPPVEFTIAGADKQFVPAEASIDGDTLVVFSPRVKNPVAVRHAWRDDAQPNLQNAAGLPAGPFRTDDWTPVTAGKF